MKRSEFDAEWDEAVRGDGIPLPSRRMVAALLAVKAGVTWDPEEPEIVWDRGSVRLLADGRWQFLTMETLGGWIDCRPDERIVPIYDELARRLLAERELSIAMEGQRTEVREALADGRLKQATVPGPLPWEKTEIADLPDGDRAAALGTAAWIEGERICRDLGGEVRSEEAAGRRRIARILKAGKSSYWYAKHIGKVFEVELVEAEGQFKGSARVAGYRGGHYVQPEDMEYLEFLDLGS